MKFIDFFRNKIVVIEIFNEQLFEADMRFKKAVSWSKSPDIRHFVTFDCRTFHLTFALVRVYR